MFIKYYPYNSDYNPRLFWKEYYHYQSNYCPKNEINYFIIHIIK